MDLFNLVFTSLSVLSAYGSPVDRTHLVTMRKAEMMDIIDCVSKAMEPMQCRLFSECEKLMPQQVLMTVDVCKQSCGAGAYVCSAVKPLFPSLEIPSKIFDCVDKNTVKLNTDERRQMVAFESCIRNLHATRCKYPRHYQGLPPQVPPPIQRLSPLQGPYQGLPPFQSLPPLQGIPTV